MSRKIYSQSFDNKFVVQAGTLSQSITSVSKHQDIPTLCRSVRLIQRIKSESENLSPVTEEQIGGNRFIR